MSAAAIEPSPSSAARLVRSSSTVALGTLLSRVTGLVRVAVLAYAIGQATLADSYNLANTTPNIVYELLIGGVLSATLVPVFVDHLQRARRSRHLRRVHRHDDGAGRAHRRRDGVRAVDRPALLARRRPASERAAQLSVMTFLIRCFLPQMCFYGFTALAARVPERPPAVRGRRVRAGAEQRRRRRACSSRSAGSRPGPQENWVDVARIQGDDGLLLLLGLGTTAGIAAMALVLVPAVARAGAHLRFVFDWRNAAVKQVVRLSGWTVGYVVTNQLALLFVLVLAATGDAGNVSAYQYAFIFFQLPHGLFAVSIMTTTTPELARQLLRRRPPGHARRLHARAALHAPGRGPVVRRPRGARAARGLDPRARRLRRVRRDRHRRHAAGVRARARAVLRVPLHVARLLRPAGHAHAVPRERVRERVQRRCSRSPCSPRSACAGSRSRTRARTCSPRSSRSCCSTRRIGDILPPEVDRDRGAVPRRRRRARCRRRVDGRRDRARHPGARRTGRRRRRRRGRARVRRDPGRAAGRRAPRAAPRDPTARARAIADV